MRPTLRAKVAFRKRAAINGKASWDLDWKFQRFPIVGSQSNFVDLHLPVDADRALFGIVKKRVRDLNRRA